MYSIIAKVSSLSLVSALCILNVGCNQGGEYEYRQREGTGHSANAHGASSSADCKNRQDGHENSGDHHDLNLDAGHGEEDPSADENHQEDTPNSTNPGNNSDHQNPSHGNQQNQSGTSGNHQDGHQNGGNSQQSYPQNSSDCNQHHN